MIEQIHKADDLLQEQPEMETRFSIDAGSIQIPRPRAMAIVAHPDDEVLIAGGTLKKLSEAGWDLGVLYFTKSEEAHYGQESMVDRVDRAIKEAELARKVLGIKHYWFGSSADMMVTDHTYVVLQEVIEHVRAFKPDVVFTHQITDFHSDHKRIGELVPEAIYQACREVSGSMGPLLDKEPLILRGDVDLECRNMTNPDLVIDISDHVQFKKEALTCYDSLILEHPLFTHDALADWVETSCRARGLIGGVKYGEGFNYGNLTPLLWPAEKLDELKPGGPDQ